MASPWSTCRGACASSRRRRRSTRACSWCPRSRGWGSRSTRRRSRNTRSAEETAMTRIIDIETAMTRLLDMEVSVPRFDVGDDQAHTAPGRGAPAVDTDRPAGYGMANYARIFKARQEGADHRPASELDTFMEGLGKLGVERALPFGVDNDEIAELLRRYPGRIVGLARISAFKGM